MLSFGLSFQRAVQRTRWMVLLLVAWSGASAQTSEIAGTLPEDYLPALKPILENAVKQAPQMVLKQIEFAASESRVYQEGAQRFPNVDGNVRYDITQQSTTGSPASRSSGFFYRAGISQAVFRWGEVKNRTEIARIQVAINGKNLAEAYRLLVVQLRTLYLSLVAENAGLRQGRYDLDLKRTQVATAKEKLQRGEVSAGYVAALELDLSDSELTVDRLVAKFDSDRRTLSRLAGISPDIAADQIPFEIPAPRYQGEVAKSLLAAMLRDGAQGTFAYQAADMSSHQADLKYRIQRVRLLPKFNASLNHELNNWTEVAGGTVSQRALTNDTIELRGDWTIFDGFATKGAKLEAKADKRLWEQRKKIESEAAMDEAQQLERSLGLDARGVDIAQQRFAGAQDLVKRAEEEAKAGTGSQTGVNDAIHSLRWAEANLANARAAFLSSWSAFLSRVSEDPALKNLPLRYVRPTR